MAFVQGRPGATVDLDVLEARCAESLSGYKRPTEITILEALPKNAVGKLDKKTLRDVHALVPQATDGGA